MIRQIAITPGAPSFSEDSPPKGVLLESTSHYISYVKSNPADMGGAWTSPGAEAAPSGRTSGL